MNNFSDTSCEVILYASVAIDKAVEQLDQLPESERLADIIDQLANVVAELDAILKDEGF